jgi:arylsulfatase A-like enzyme
MQRAKIRFAFALVYFFALLLPAFSVAQEPSPKRNVLLIMTDDCNCDLGCYGHALVKTPNIDRLAGRGMRFEKAYCQYPVCNPSRSSMMTGLYPDQTGVLSNKPFFRDHIPDVVTLPQMFRNAGYWVGRVGKIYHYNVPDHIGKSGMDDPASWEVTVNPRGIDREVHDQIHTLQKGKFGGTLSWLNLKSKANEHTDGVAATEAIRLLKERDPAKTGKPFFLAVGFYRPHTPYVAPPEFFDLYPRDSIVPVMEKADDRDDIPMAAWYDRPKQRDLSVEKRKEIIQAYYASISLMDMQLGRVLDAVDQLGLRENTTIVFASDHGYHLGAHGIWQKGDLFEGSCHVPMVISDPSFPAGKSTSSLAGLIDVYPTLAELTEVQAPKHLRGKSLIPILKNENSAVNDEVLTVSVSRARWMHKEFTNKKVKGYTIRTKRYRYTQWGLGEHGHELYDYESDPNEYSNLADIPEHSSLVKDLESRLRSSVQYAQ